MYSNASAAVGLVATPAAMYFEFDGNLLQTILNACVITPSQPASVF